MPGELPPSLRHPTAVVVGVSGGVDSVVLLHWLKGFSQLRVHVAHFDHGLRAESAGEAAWVAALAEQWGLPVTVGRAAQDLRGVAGYSIEEAARQARYCFLAEVAKAVGASAVAVAHHRDDQAETVLMHFIRGSGLAGLRGMVAEQPLRDLRLPCDVPDVTLVRPLLGVGRAEIEAYAAAQGLRYQQDASNDDVRLFRNKLRHEVLPYLAGLNPNIRVVLAHTADVLAEDYALVQAVVDAAWGAVAQVRGAVIVLSRGGWAALAVGVRRALLRRAVWMLRPDLRDVDYTPVVRAVVALDHAGIGQQVSLPGDVVVTVDREWLHVAVGGGMAPPEDWPWLAEGETVGVSVPGRTWLTECGWEVVVTDVDAGAAFAVVAENTDHFSAWLDADQIAGGLVLRRRQAGEVIAPLGLSGRRQWVSDLLSNEKLPLAVRAGLPVMVDDEKVVWVVGVRLDERVKVSAESRRVWRVVMRPAD